MRKGSIPYLIIVEICQKDNMYFVCMFAVVSDFRFNFVIRLEKMALVNAKTIKHSVQISSIAYYCSRTFIVIQSLFTYH